MTKNSNTKYKHTASIIGAGGAVVGRMRKDTIKRVHFTRRALHIETRKGHHAIMPWFRSLLWVR